MTKPNSKVRQERSGAANDDLNDLSCDVSLAFVVRGALARVQQATDDIQQALDKNGLRAVYRVLYPGRIKVVRVPVSESTRTEREIDERT